MNPYEDPLTEEEEREFEGMLRKGEGRLRLTVPHPHSTYDYGDVALNIGTSELVDDMHYGVENIPFHLAPPRSVGERRDCIDIAVHPSALANTSELHRLTFVRTVAQTVAQEYPDLEFNPLAVPERLPQAWPLFEVTIEMSKAQLNYGKEVLAQALSDTGKPKGALIEPLYCRETAVDTRHPEEIDVYFFEDEAAPGVGVIEIFVEDELAAVLRPKLPKGEPVTQRMCRATYKKRARRLLIRVYADDIDASAALLQDKLLATKAKKRRAQNGPEEIRPEEGVPVLV